MTGSVQIKNGYWYTVINTKGSDGKSKQKWDATGLKEKGNKLKAKQILRKRIEEYEQKVSLVSCNMYFDAFMNEWLGIIKSQVKANTYHQYSLIVRNTIIPYFAPLQIALCDLQPHHIQAFYSEKLKSGVSGNTIKHYHANIRKALKYALKQNWILFNPADRVELPKVAEYIGNFYTPKQIQKLLTLVQDTNIETPVLLTVVYGLRRSEAIGIKWNAVDFKNRTITIQHTVVGSGAQLVASDTTKTKASTRTYQLHPRVAEHLQTVHNHQREMRLLLGSSYHDSDYVCTWDDGRLIRPEYLSRKFKKIVSKSDLPLYRYHDLRHSSASMLIQEGRSLKEVGTYLGHTNINTTNRYAHLTFQSTVEMVDSIGLKLFAAH